MAYYDVSGAIKPGGAAHTLSLSQPCTHTLSKMLTMVEIYLYFMRRPGPEYAAAKITKITTSLAYPGKHPSFGGVLKSYMVWRNILLLTVTFLLAQWNYHLRLEYRET